MDGGRWCERRDRRDQNFVTAARMRTMREMKRILRENGLGEGVTRGPDGRGKSLYLDGIFKDLPELCGIKQV